MLQEACPEAFTTGLSMAAGPYPFGVDPVWHGSRSELPYLNSVKMKMSILLGALSANSEIRCPSSVDDRLLLFLGYPTLAYQK